MSTTETKLEDKTHWKRLINPDYLGAHSVVPGKDMVLTIKSVVREMVKGQGGKKEECTVAKFVEQVKPMILNRTNCKTITSLYATPYIEDWGGKKISVFATTTSVAGETVECLRIRPVIPNKELPELTPEHPKWVEVKEKIKNGEAEISVVKKHFKLSPENEKSIIE